MKVSLLQLLAGLGTSVGAGCLTATTGDAGPIGAASAAVALSGVAGTLLSNVGTELASDFKARLKLRWSQSPTNPEVSRTLFRLAIDAAADILQETENTARHNAHDPELLHRWTNVVVPFGNELRNVLTELERSTAEFGDLGVALDRAFEQSVAEWVDKQGSQDKFGASVAARMLACIAEAQGIAEFDMPVEFITEFKGQRAGSQSWFVRFGLVTVLCRSPISLGHLGFEGEWADAAQI